MQHVRARRGDAPAGALTAVLVVAMAFVAGAFVFARRSAEMRRATKAMRLEQETRAAQAAARAAAGKGATQTSPVPAWVVAIHKGDAELARADYSRACSLYEEGMVDAGVDAGSDEGTRSIVRDAYFNLARVMSMMSTGRTSPSSDARALTPEEAEELRAKAFKMLEKARNLGWKDRAAAEAEKDFEPISKDPRWQKLLETLGR